jgi:cobaltochelatase CobS
MTNEITIASVTYSRSELETSSREVLRALARTAHRERGSSVSLTWLGSAAKSADLVAFIMGDTRDYGFGSLDQSLPLQPVAFEQTDVAPPQSREAQAMASLASALSGFLPNGHVDKSEVESIVSEATDQIENNLVAYVERCQQNERERYNREISEALEAFNQRCYALAEQIKGSSNTLRIEVSERAPIEVSGLRHKSYDDLLADILAFEATKQTHRANFWLVGPAGTGKTTAAEKIAEALEMPFYFNGAIDSEYKLRGFIDAQGRVISTPFRRAYEHGGVYLFDEVDSSLPSACLAFNAALANGKYDFPGCDEPIARNPRCFVLAASNTWGGPDGGYVGRFRQDAAFMDRFLRVPWETDEALEKALCSNQDWCAYVQTARASAIRNGVEHLISPRATLNGDALLAAGRPWQRVVDLCVRKGLNEADWKKIIGGVN